MVIGKERILQCSDRTHLKEYCQINLSLADRTKKFAYQQNTLLDICFQAFIFIRHLMGILHDAVKYTGAFVTI